MALSRTIPATDPIRGPGTWQASDFTGPEDWTLTLSDAVLAELDCALTDVQAAGAPVTTLTVRDFPLPSFASEAAAIRDRLWNGSGFVVLRGIAAERYSQEEMLMLYWGICSHLGIVLPQTVRGDRIYSVRDEGYNLERDYGAAGVRTSKTTSAFGFHTDSPSRLAGHTPDVIGLLVLRTARAGGESALVSAAAAHNVMLHERPEYLRRLYEPFWVDRRAELPPGEPPVLPVPVFAFDGRLAVRYVRLYIDKGHQIAGAPLLESDRAALDYFEEVMKRPALALRLELHRGDIQLVNNVFLLHGRTHYEDYPEPHLKRHYVRLWLGAAAH
jgi:hypothetical protein